MKIIFSDLDGTLLNHQTYSYDAAEKALDLIKINDIPLIFCTSKTKSEIEYWREKIGNSHPFIAENGAAIYIPKQYFNAHFTAHKSTNQYDILEFGTPVEYLVNIMNDLKTSFSIQSFHEMSPEEIAQDTGLDLSQAIRAKQRKYSIPFKSLKHQQEKRILEEIKDHNLKCVIGGRYYHLMGNNSKGYAVNVITNQYKKSFHKTIISIGIGDSQNDFSMLDVVDKAYLVMKENGTYASSGYHKAGAMGPKGWQKVIEKEFYCANG